MNSMMRRTNSSVIAAACLVEAKRQRITPYLITVDSAGHDYLRYMCDDMGYEVVADIDCRGEAVLSVQRLRSISKKIVIFNIVVHQGCFMKRLDRHCRSFDAVREFRDVLGAARQRPLATRQRIVDR